MGLKKSCITINMDISYWPSKRRTLHRAYIMFHAACNHILSISCCCFCSLQGEGAAYRGRVLLSLATELGDPPDDPIVNISAHDIQRVDKYRRLRKYHLYAAFINATMVSETDLPVEFEVIFVSVWRGKFVCERRLKG